MLLNFMRAFLLDVNTSSVLYFSNKNRVSPQCWPVQSVGQSNKDCAIMIWHSPLGHPNFLYMKRLFPSLFINKNPNLYHCEICQFAKHTRNTTLHNLISQVIIFPSFMVIFGDQLGFLILQVRDGFCCWLTIIPDYVGHSL